jgi:hypothetical protein
LLGLDDFLLQSKNMDSRSWWVGTALLSVYLAFEFSRFDGESTLPPQLTPMANCNKSEPPVNWEG